MFCFSVGSYYNDKLYFKKGDIVIVLSGKYKGQIGKVLFVLFCDQKVVVEGVNVIIKNVKFSMINFQGGQEQCELVLYVSKVVLVDFEIGKVICVCKQIVDGKKVCVVVVSGKIID